MKGEKSVIHQWNDMNKAYDRVEWILIGKNVIEDWVFIRVGKKDNEMCHFSAVFFSN